MNASGPFSPTVPAGPSQFTASATAAPAAGSIMSPVRAAETRHVPLLGKTRWRKTPTTFGPLGRVLLTLVLVVPLPVFIVIAVFSGGLEAGGAVIWGLIVMPLGLRDVWKAGTYPLN
jgi:hypothetical protein